MRRALLTLILAGVMSAQARAADKPLVFDVWPGPAPGDKGNVGEEKTTKMDRGVTIVTNVTKPTLTVFRPAKDKDTGAAVVIAPGGAYRGLAWDLEGEEVAAWLNSIGVTGIVLK